MTNKNGKRRECAIFHDEPFRLLTLHCDGSAFSQAAGSPSRSHTTRPSPPRTEEEVKESKRRATLRKLGGRAAADDENVVFNPSAFASASALPEGFEGVGVYVGVEVRGLCRWVSVCEDECTWVVSLNSV
jgi:hypothetical protein